jgi:hypothetical protein
MALEASAVQIVVNVTDANSAAVIGGVEQNIQKLGAAGTRSGGQVSAGMNQMGVGALSAREKTRLLTEEFGIRLPRAMQTLLSRVPAVQSALNAVGTAMISLGAIQIGAMVFEALIRGAEKLWDRLTALPKAVREYNAEMEKSRNEAFGDTHSIELTRARIDDCTDSLKRYSDQVEKVRSGPLGMGTPSITWRSLVPIAGAAMEIYNQFTEANDLQTKAIEEQRKLDALQHSDSSQYHKQMMDENELRAAERDAAAKDAKSKHDAQIQNAREAAAEERRYNNEQDSRFGLSVGPQSGAAQEKATVLKAQIKADAELADQKDKHAGKEKDDTAELARLHEQAIESGLRGSALYHQQEAYAIEDLKRRGITSARAVEDVHTKYHNEQMKRLDDENRAVQKMREETQLAGLTGMARIQQEGRNRLEDVYDKPTNDPGARLAEIKAVNDETARQVDELNRSFSERVDSIVGQSAARELQGFARIRAEAQNQIRSLQEELDKNGGRPEDLARGVAGINAGAAGQTADLARRNEQETAQIETQARAKLFSAEKNKTAAIKVELDERLAKYKEELDAQLISQDDFNRRSIAAHQEANAEMVEASKQARDKMAGEFTSLFENWQHPLQSLEKEAEKQGAKMAGQLAADAWQHVQQHGQKKDAAGNPIQAPPQGGILGYFGSFFGGKKGSGASPGESAGGAHAEKSIAISHADIQIGSAAFGGGSGNAGGGGGGFTAGGSPGASWSRPGGSTALLAGGVSGGAGGFSGGSTGGYSHGFGGGGTWGGASQGSAGISAFAGGAAGGAANYFGGSSSSGSSKKLGGAGSGGGAGALPNFTQGSGEAPPKRSLMSLLSGGSGYNGQGSGPGAVSQNKGSGQTNTGNTSSSQSGSGTSDTSSSGNSQGTGTQDSPTGAASASQGSASQGAQNTGGYATSGTSGGLGTGGTMASGNEGAQKGSQFGPIGEGIGAAIGMIAGAIGSREKARVYDLKEVRPRIANDEDQYHQGSLDYTSAYSDEQSLIGASWAVTKNMGGLGKHYWTTTIKPEIMQSMAKLSAEEKAGRSQYTQSKASYASGTDYVPSAGQYTLHPGERVMPSDQNERITQAIEGNGKMPVQSSSGGDVHLHVHAIDAQGVSKFLDTYKHNIASAVNDSRGENSGGGLN